MATLIAIRPGRNGLAETADDPVCPAATGCFHCGAPLRGGVIHSQERAFCCQGCRTVFEILAEHGMTDFYRFGTAAGVRVSNAVKKEEFKYLDDPAVRRQLVDFADDRITRVSFRIPSIHCIACVWLLENLFRLKPGVGHAHVNFPRKEVCITFENSRVTLGELVAFLASLG